MKVSGYCSRWTFILDRCLGKTVLHLGCIGETEVPPHAKLEAFAAGQVLHPQLAAIARSLVGVDIDAATVELIHSRLGQNGILAGDVEHLESLALEGTFDIVLCGNLLEHLSCPGRVLDGVRRFMTPSSQLIISVPNSFALLANLRFCLGRFREGTQHVASFSKFNIETLVERHGFHLKELYSAYDQPPTTWEGRIKLAWGAPFFKLLPERGGTLLAVASLSP